MKTTANYGLKKPEGTDVVNIDDLNTNADTIDTQLKKINDNAGALSSLNTTAKNTLVAAINEVFQSGADVKSGTISAVNNKGASLDDDATWDDIVAAINAIARGQGNAVESQVLSGIKFSNSDGQLRTGTMPNKGAITITPSGSAQTIPLGYHNGSGKVSAVTVPVANVLSGTTIAGQAGTMPNKGAVTITPGTADKAIEKGYHNGSGKVKGEPNLKAENIPEGMSMFGIAGVLEKKQDISPFLLGDAANHRKEIISPLASLNECWGTNYTDPHTLYKYDEGGNVIQTIEGTGDDYFICVSKNYILKTLKNGLGLLDKNGTLLKTISKTGARHGVIDEKNNRIVFYSGGLNVYTLDNISYLASNDSLEKAMIFIVNKDTVIVTNYYSSSSSTSDYYSAVVDKNNSINITLNRWNNFII